MRRVLSVFKPFNRHKPARARPASAAAATA